MTSEHFYGYCFYLIKTSLKIMNNLNVETGYAIESRKRKYILTKVNMIYFGTPA